VLFAKSLVEGLRGGDPVPLEREAQALCRQCGIADENIAGALREW
jgi:hypothetical protein